MNYLKLIIYLSFTLICMLLQLAFVLESFTLKDPSRLPLLPGFTQGMTVAGAILSFPVSWLCALIGQGLPGGLSHLFPIAPVTLLNPPLDWLRSNCPVVTRLDPRLWLGPHLNAGQFNWPLLLAIPAWNALERFLIGLLDGEEQEQALAEKETKALALQQKFQNGGVSSQPQTIPTAAPPDKTLYQQIFNDLKNEVRKLESEVHLDALTQLYNKGYFQKRLKTEMLNAKSTQGYLSLIMIDLDNFKQLNDTYGHIIGDQALIETGRCLQRVAHEARNAVACRYGGEELALILCNQNPTIGEQVAETLCRMIQTIRLPDVPQVQLTASLGVYTVEYKPTNGSYDLSPSLLVAKADEQMYQAKRAGKNRVCNARLI